MVLCLLFPLWALEIPQSTGNVQIISVGVSGYVDNPGFYKLTVLDRLSDAIEAAKAEVIPPTYTKVEKEKLVLQEKNMDLPDSTLTKTQAFRSVTLIRGNTKQVYDLKSFLRTGDISQNPALRDGDVVVLNPILETVSISGSVYYPEDYEYLPGDKLKDILGLAKGFRPEADTKRIKLYRYQENMIDFQVIDLDLSTHLQNPSILDFPLMPYDRIMVPLNSQYRRNWTVQISGHVSSPGEYQINESTTLYDVLLQSGGPTPKADLENSVIINRAVYQREDLEFERLKELNMSTMTPLEYNYMRSKLRQLKGKYSLSAKVAWESEGKENNPTLRDGDHIYIPEQIDMVWVSGQVRNPGLVPYVEGKNWKYYVQAAGGYTNNRRFGGVRIIRSSSGNWVKPSKNLVIRSGDIVFIPEATDRDIWLDIKDVALLTSQVITIIIGFRTLTNN